MFEIEELIKSADKKNLKAMLRQAAIFANPASTQEMKDQARDNILAINRNEPTSPEKISNLESAMAAAKPDLSNKINENISESIKTRAAGDAKVKKETDEAGAEKRAKIRAHERLNGRGPWHSHKIDPNEWEKFHPDVKKFFTDKEDPEKKAKREEWNHDNQVLTGGEHTRKELKASAARAEGLEKPKEIKVRETTPAQKVTAAKNKVKSTIDSALGLVHDAHANGLHDVAANVLNAIPREHMPSNMKGYNPAYIHYDVTPNHWAALSPEHRETLQQTHMDVMNGKHDNNPDPSVQKIVSKVKPLPKPPSS